MKKSGRIFLFGLSAFACIGLTGGILVQKTLESPAIVHAEASSAKLTFTKACGGKGTDTGGNAWTITSDAAESTFDSQNGRGIHYGTKSAQVSHIKAACASVVGTISRVVVNCSANMKGSPKVKVEVGGTAFGTEKSITESNAAYTFEGTASGEIVVTVFKDKTQKALYLKSIEVFYSNDVPASSGSESSSSSSTSETTESSTDTAPEEEKYSKVTSSDGLIVGSKVTITSADGKKAISATQSKNNRVAVDVASIDPSESVKVVGNMGVFELGSADQKASGAYSFKDSNGYLCAASSGSNYLKSNGVLDSNGSWSISFDEKGTISVKANGQYTRNVLRYNSASSLFSCYASGQSPVAIYQHAPVEITDSIWADNFLVKIGGACQMSGSTNKETLEHQWNVVKALTDKMDKTTLKDVVGNVSGTNIERAIARYEFVASKYGFEDYLGRGVEKVAQSRSLVMGEERNNILAVVSACVFAGAVITVGLFFALKKKKA